MPKEDVRTKKLKEGEIIPITFDFMFQAIFNNEENIDILEAFLSSYLEVSLDVLKGNVKLLSRNLKLEQKRNRSVQIDLLVDIIGEKINIELTSRGSQSVLERNLVYASKVFGSQLKYGDNEYSNILPTIQILLNNFRCNSNKIKRSFYLKDEEV